MKTTLILLIIIEFYNGISALAGGIGLLGDPSARSLGMELSWLEGTPFKNFLIPGIILFVFNGIGNTVAAILSIRKYKYLAEIAIFFGFGMMIWIIVQVVLIGYASFLQPLYFSTGLIQLILGSILRKTYKQQLNNS